MQRAFLHPALLASFLLLLALACGNPPHGGEEKATGSSRGSDETAAGPSDPSEVEEVLGAFRQAMGGEEALAAIRSVRGTAQCTGPDGPYTTEIQSTRAGHLLFHQTRQGEEGPIHFRAFVNGPYTWSELVGGDELTPQPVKLRAMIRGHDFFAWALDFPFILNDPQVEGRTEFEGEASIQLRLRDNFKRPARAFFSQTTHLLLGLEMHNPLVPPEVLRLRIVEWKEVGGVLLPSRQVVTDGTGDFDLHYQEILVNDVDESLFEVPEEILRAAEERRRAREQASPDPSETGDAPQPPK